MVALLVGVCDLRRLRFREHIYRHPNRQAVRVPQYILVGDTLSPDGVLENEYELYAVVSLLSVRVRRRGQDDAF